MKIKLKELKEKYEYAKTQQLETITIQGNEFVTDYLKYLIQHLEQNLKAKPESEIELTPAETEWTIIYATKGKGFQEYKYSNGERVPDGAPIGIEKDDELILLNGIFYSDEADNYEDDEEDVAYDK